MSRFRRSFGPGPRPRVSRTLATVPPVVLMVAVVLLSGPAGSAGDGSSRRSGGVDLIATEVPLGSQSSGAPGERLRSCAAGSRLVRLSPSAGRTVVAAGLDAACDPVLAPGGTRLVFRGRERPRDPWRIWELDLGPGGGGDPRALSPADRVCVRPVVLADGGVGFVCEGELFRTAASGDAPAGAGVADLVLPPVRLTASAGAIEEAAVLPDGRLLLRTTDGDGAPVLLTAQPDGTWATRWRDAPVAGLEAVRPLPPDGLLLVTGTPEAGGLWIGSLNDPFAPLRAVAHEALDGMVVRDPAVLPDGQVVVALRPEGADRFRLARLAAGGDEVVELVEPQAPARGGAREPRSPGHVLQPMPIAPRPPETEIPSIVNPELNTGYLVLFDAARSDHPVYGGIDRSAVAAVRIFPWEDGSAGETAVDLPPADDGSLHLEVPADRPLGLVLIDDEGRPLGPQGGPLWVRPNERRACMGCHVSRRYAPPNVRPEALLDPPRWVGWGAERVSPRSELEEGSH